MEMENIVMNRTGHHGRNIKRIRKEKGIKQEVVAEKTFLSQQSVSRYEAMKDIDDEMLERFAKALEVTVDEIKNLDEKPLTIIFENNCIETNNGSVKAYVEEDNSKNSFNPVDKIVELCERMLKSDQEKIALLEQLLKQKK